MNREPERPLAVVLGVQLADVSDAEHASSLAELGRLASTLGLEVIAEITQKRVALARGGVVGEGKLKELARWTGGTGVVPSGATPQKKKQVYAGHEVVEDEPLEPEAPEEEGAPAKRKAKLVLVDHDLSPSQAKNLERATGAEVLDRTGVILGIFHRHARSKEARLQVEIARLSYMAPRLRETGATKERQRGGIGGRGAGESAMELDRRKIRDRIAELKHELAGIEKESGNRRRKRSEQSKVALVGYTNAGKSSLMRGLTGSPVYVADELFATVDTTVRALKPEAKPRILVSDTVGFIKKLPHDLVASFRSTLDEARDAQLILHVVDAADAAHEAQIAVTREVLAEIGADLSPHLLLLNKIDQVDAAGREALAARFPDAIELSAHQPADVAALRSRIVAFFEQAMSEEEIFVPYAEQRLVSELHEHARIVEEHHEEEGTRLRVRALPEVLARYRRTPAPAT